MIRFCLNPRCRVYFATIAGIIGVVCAAGETRADNGPLNLESFIQSSLPTFARSPTAGFLQKSIESNRLSTESALEESPFSDRTDLNYSVFPSDNDPNDLLAFTRRTNSWVLTQELDYKLRSSLAATLTATYDYDTYQQPILLGDPLDRPFQVSLKLSYDVLRGGARSLDNSNAYASAAQSRQRIYSNYSDLTVARVQYTSLLTDIFVTQCKIVVLKGAQETVEKTVRTGNLQEKTKTIAHKEYLNFVDLENSFARRMATLQSSSESLLKQLLAWGDDASKLSLQLQSTPLQCDLRLEELIKKIRTYRLSQADLESIARVMPTTGAATASREASEHLLRVAHLTNLPSLLPYVQGGYSQTPHSLQPFDSGTVGVTLQWTPPLSKGAKAESAAQFALDSSERQEQKAVYDNTAHLSDLESQIQSQENILNVLQRSLENSHELLRTLEAYRAIGGIDSLNYANAYINSIDAHHALFDSWGTLEKTMFEFREYRAWKKN